MEVSPPYETNVFFGHKQQERSLLSLLQQNKLPHGLLFTGPKGVGKATCAYRLARGLFLKEQQGFINSFDMLPDHPIFRRILQGSHGDLKIVSSHRMQDVPTKKSQDIGIEEIREIIHFLQQTPLEGNIRCVVIEEAENLTMQAANALLKSLEEPPAHSYLFLCAHDEQALLQTLKSRLQRVYFSPLKEVEEDQLLSYLSSQDSENNPIKIKKREFFKGAPGQLLLYVQMGGDAFYEALKETFYARLQKKMPSPQALIDKYFSKDKGDKGLSFEEKIFVFLSLFRGLLFADESSPLISLKEEQKIKMWDKVHGLLTEAKRYDLDVKQTWTLVFQEI